MNTQKITLSKGNDDLLERLLKEGEKINTLETSVKEKNEKIEKLTKEFNYKTKEIEQYK